MNITQGPGDVTLITCTRDRPAMFPLCERWMSRQTFQGKMQWLVVDDGDVACAPSMGQMHIRRQPSKKGCTLADNLLDAIPHIKSPKILFFEDDDWYAPIFVEHMVNMLDKAEVVGLQYIRYYHVGIRHWQTVPNTSNSALSTTGLRDNMLRRFQWICEMCVKDECPWVDLRFWGTSRTPWDMSGPLDCTKHMFESPYVLVGIKGGPGRFGLSPGHEHNAYTDKEKDLDLSMLRSWIGDDADAYADFYKP